MLLIQCRYVVSHSLGHEANGLARARRALRQTRHRSTAARQRSWIDLPGKYGCVAGAGFFMSTNHWSVSIGSTISPVRPQRGTTIVCAFSDTSSPAALEVREHRLARGVAVETAVLFRRVGVDRRIEVEDRDRRQTVALRRSSQSLKSCAGVILTAAGAELAVDVGVGDDRESCGRSSGSATVLPTRRAIALVVRVHRDRDVAQHRLGPRRRDDDVDPPPSASG